MFMSRPESHELIEHIQVGAIQEYRKQEQEKYLAQFSTESIRKDFDKLQIHLDDSMEPMLRQGIYSGFIGALYAFRDRDLDPLHKDHYGLFQTIRKDIESAYKEVSMGGLEESLWLFETFDYGIKHVYYLDWQLYLSKTCY